jgi:hypothetical protein
MFRFWRHCYRKPCRRAHRCRGEVYACWRLFRPAIPDELIATLHHVVQARAAGASSQEAIRIARERMAAVNAGLARLKQLSPRPAERGEGCNIQQGKE